jgi:hypothetical protein
MSKSQTPKKDAPLMKCADCLHAKQYREVNPATRRYVLKVKCTKGHWRKGRKHGECDLHRVLARRRHKCADYVSMSDSEEDRRECLKILSATLPLEQIVYEPNGEPVDITEVTAWQSVQ